MIDFVPDEPRTIIVRWHDAQGHAHSERRRVNFAKGFGPYIRWNRRPILVDSMQTEITVEGIGPTQVNHRLVA